MSIQFDDKFRDQVVTCVKINAKIYSRVDPDWKPEMRAGWEYINVLLWDIRDYFAERMTGRGTNIGIMKIDLDGASLERIHTAALMAYTMIRKTQSYRKQLSIMESKELLTMLRSVYRYIRDNRKDLPDAYKAQAHEDQTKINPDVEF